MFNLTLLTFNAGFFQYRVAPTCGQEVERIMNANNTGSCNGPEHITDIRKPDMGLMSRFSIIEVNREKVSVIDTEVCVEESVNIILNGVRVASLTITPDDLEAFGYGYLVCEGLIKNISMVESLEIKWPNIYITVKKLEAGDVDLWMEIRSSGCVGVRSSWMGLDSPIDSEVIVEKDTIFYCLGLINDMAKLWSATGGTHCTIIFDRLGGLVSYAEDIGRHNSIDKAVGKALLDGRDLTSCFMVCTGRMPAGMVAKAYRAGIPIVVSNTAPLTTGIELARKLNMTLICFARPPRMYVYSGPERVGNAGVL